MAATICAITNPGISAGAMPTNVFVRLRATVTAGFAKNVDDVNQYPATTVSETNRAIFSLANLSPK